MKDTARGEIGYYKRFQPDSKWSQHCFLEFGKTTDFFLGLKFEFAALVQKRALLFFTVSSQRNNNFQT